MKYKVGDRVTIRSWEIMKKEFGLTCSGSINTPIHNFDTDMKKFCGRQLTVKKVYDKHYSLVEAESYGFTDEMIAHNFTVGEEIEVCDIYDGHPWFRCIFVGYCDGCGCPFNVATKDEWKQFPGKKMAFNWYCHARKIPSPPSIVEVTLDEIAKWKGVEAKRIKILEK